MWRTRPPTKPRLVGHPWWPARLGLAFSALLVHTFGAQEPGFQLSTEDPRHAPPAFLGNGYLGVVTSPSGVGAAPSFLAGVYDHAPGDVPRLAVLPAWSDIDLFNARSWLNAAVRRGTDVLGYRQTLDLHDGLLRTRYEWVDGDRATLLEVESFVSRAEAGLAAIRLAITPKFPGRLKVVLPVKAWPPPRRLRLAELERTRPGWGIGELWYPGHVVVRTARAEQRAGGARLWLEGETEGRRTRVALAARVGWRGELPRVETRTAASEREAVLEVGLDADSGRTYVFEKLVAVASARDTANPLSRALERVDSAAARGYDALLAEHAAEWRRLWGTDIVIEGDAELQRVVRAMLFYLLSSVREETGMSIPPMGLSGAGYYGHVFWDADTYMFPPLAVTHPGLARSMVLFRYHTLEAARAKARQYAYEGAMYPWEADELGHETTPRFAEQNALMEIHIVGDVALAQWQYFLATGDTAYLRQYGYPVIAATADFWVSRVTYNPERDRYETRRLVSVDEGLIGISNDTYTNAVAKLNLEIATSTSRLVGREPNPDWARVAAKMYIPFDAAGQYHPTYEDAPAETLGEVVPLLSYPLALPMTAEAKWNNLRHAVRRFEERGGGAMMGTTFYPLLAAELGDRELFEHLVHRTYRPWLRGPFLALAETPRNDAVSFLTGAGGFLQQVIFGWTGLRVAETGLVEKYPPMLPSSVERLVLKNFTACGRRYDIVVEGDNLRFVPK